jgi:LysR family transcriptional regulator for bpeEF and oprC
MIRDLRGLLVFARVVETRNFTHAARHLGVTKSAVSKQVAGLESELGVQLLVRTTRKLSLTEAGERVYASCARIAQDVEAAEDAARQHTEQAAGHLRIASSSGLGRTYLVPLMTEFLLRHPRVTAELVLGDGFVDLVKERIDIALRVGSPGESSLVTRTLTSIRALLCASPRYLAARGTPRTPKDLADHEFVLHGSMDPVRLVFRRGGRVSKVAVKGRLSCDDGPAAIAASISGFGIVMVPEFEVAEEIRDGRLVTILPGFQEREWQLNVVFPPRKHVPMRTRAFADFAVERWRVPPWR